jgi:hypothetical protein
MAIFLDYPSEDFLISFQNLIDYFQRIDADNYDIVWLLKEKTLIDLQANVIKSIHTV